MARRFTWETLTASGITGIPYASTSSLIALASVAASTCPPQYALTEPFRRLNHTV